MMKRWEEEGLMDDGGSYVRPGDDVTTKGRREEGDDPRDASTQKEPEGRSQDRFAR